MATEPQRPHLLPQNRKLRHLQGIYIRNLTLARPRGVTTDDAALLTPLKSPPEHGLHHAHSSSELNNLGKGAETRDGEGSVRSEVRPSQMRRRSTNWNWSSGNATPDSRQKKLEGVIEQRMADTFFSLHVKNDAGMIENDPIYISEVVTRAMNPSFRFFDLDAAGPRVTRRDAVVVKVWVKRKDSEIYGILVEEDVDLRRLRFIGKLEGNAFPANAILFHLQDGIYSHDLLHIGKVMKLKPKEREGAELETSSYSALMRLSNLDESIQDALATREELAQQINKILKEVPKDAEDVEEKEEDLKLANRYVSAERKLLKASIRRRAELKASIEARREAIRMGNSVQGKVIEDIENAQSKLSRCRTLLTNTISDIHGQRRRICEELLTIFPIEPTTHPLLFTICGLPLPNSTFEDADEDVIAAALGYVSRLVDMLQYYLAVPLSYPISPYGSRSIITDTVSILQDNQRTFPLYMKGTVRFRFDYGVFLLNKNIEALAESQGLKVMDIRQTLPNLKYLLYVCSAGSSELPSRKAGGVRGLLNRGLDVGSELGSRRGSMDSATGHDAARKALEIGNGDGGLVESKVVKDEVLSVPFGGNHIRSLRTSGLRENVR